MSSSLKASKNSVTTAKSSLTIITQAEPLRCLIWLGENLAQQSVSSHTPSWPEMRAQFEDKKLPPTDFKMTVNGKVLGSISDPGKRAAIFKVGEKKMLKIYLRL
ncbi:hypothetical protein [Zymobacter palmae]|uniref:hypothetical protein n=1 Tax=Zymobacter palmae TaxID=33074 RepID=UPI0011AE5CAC|nr:hypothetical protein [Zymobacter palmae]